MRWMGLVIVMCLSGCSFLFVSGPPPRHQEVRDFDCTTSRVAPVLDTVFGVLQGLNLLVAAGSSDQEWANNFNGKPPIERGTAIPLYIGLAALHIGSAAYGYAKTGACRQAKAESLEREGDTGPGLARRRPPLVPDDGPERLAPPPRPAAPPPPGSAPPSAAAAAPPAAAPSPAAPPAAAPPAPAPPAATPPAATPPSSSAPVAPPPAPSPQ